MSICIHLLIYVILTLSAYVVMCSEAGQMPSFVYLSRNKQVCQADTMGVWAPYGVGGLGFGAG